MKYQIGTYLRKYREAKKLYQSDVAQAVGVANSTYANWEQGTNRPSADQLVILCQVLGVSADELLGMERHEITKADEELIAAYHRAPMDVQQAVATLLNRYKRGNVAEGL